MVCERFGVPRIADCGALMGAPAQATTGGWGPMTSRDRVFNALADAGLNPHGKHHDFMALCPVHSENTGSLHVTWRNDGATGGRVLLKCFGCDAEPREIAEAIGLGVIDLFDNPPPERPQADRGLRRPQSRAAASLRGKTGPLPALRTRATPCEHKLERVETYTYVDAHGAVVQEVHRNRCTECGGKTFHQSFVDAAGNMSSAKPAAFTEVLYRLPEVLAAVSAGSRVLLLEGEKDVHTAESLGLVATTNTGGALSFTAALAAPLAGAEVDVVLDRDGSGYARGAQVYEALVIAGARSIRLLLPAVTTPKADLTDHVEAGHDIEQLIEVTLDEVQAWAAASEVEAAHKKIVQSLAEIDAHLAEADERAAKAPKTAAKARGFAERWAIETERRWEAAADKAEGFAATVGSLDTPWVLEARRLVVRLLEDATTMLHGAQARTGREIPDVLRLLDERGQQVLAAAAAPAAQPDASAGAEPSGPGADVFEFPTKRTGGGTGGGGGSRPLLTADIEKREYLLLDGKIVEQKWVWVGRGENREQLRKFTQILNLDLHLDGREYVDESGDVENEVHQSLASVVEVEPTLAEKKVAHYRFSYTHPETGKRVVFRVEADRAVTGDFLDTIDVVGLEYGQSKTDKARVVEAVRAISKDAVDTVQYSGTGWRVDPTHGWVYVTYSGLITADGLVPGNQLLQGVMARYALPRPTTDADELRRFFVDHSGAFLDRFSPRISAVLLGHMYCAPVRRNPYSVVVQGSPGSRKTGLCALAMHHFGPAWDRSRPTESMTGNGSTLNAVQITLNQAKDAVAFFDDVTPGASSVAAQNRLGEFLQMLFNQEVRNRSNRDGQSTRAGRVPHATGLFSSELTPKFGANARRAIIVPLQRHELDLQAIIDLDAPESRIARATLMASMISWAARDLPRTRHFATEAADRYSTKMREAGLTSEEAESSAFLWAGWSVMCEFLVSAGAITHAERAEWLTRAHEGIHAAVEAAQDPDSPTNAGQRLRELIASGLRSGVGHVTDVHTDGAPDDDGLAIRLGWRRVELGPGAPGDPAKTRMDAAGRRVGYVNVDADELLLDSAALEGFIKACASSLSEPFAMDAGTARRALHEVDVLKAQWDSHGRSGGRWRYTMKRTIYCETHTSDPTRRAERPMTVLKLSALLGDGDDDAQQLPPAPLPPHPVPSATDDASPAPTQETGQHADGPGAPDGDNDTPETLENDEERTAMYDEHPPVSPELDDAVVVHLLPAPAACAVCGEQARHAVDDVAIHPACWARLCDDPTLIHRPNPHQEQTRAPEPPTPVVTDQTPAAVPTQPAAAAPDQSLARTSARAKTQTRTSTRSRFLAPTAVLDVDALYLPDGGTRPAPQIADLGDVARLALELPLGTTVAPGRTDPGVIVLTDAAAERLGIQTSGLPREGDSRSTAFAEHHRQHPALMAALGAGWATSTPRGEAPTIRGWTKLWPTVGGDGVFITFVSLLSPAVRADDAGPAQIAHRLGEFARLMGTSWHVSGHSVGLDLMRALRVKRKDEFVVHDVPPVAKTMVDPDLNWCRPPSEALGETSLEYVHAYDRGGSYLAGVAGLELPVGDFVHHPEGTDFDPKIPGYWKITTPSEPADWRYPSALYTGRDRETGWVTTPTLALARELEHVEDQPEILEAYVWPAHARVLDPWYKRIREARTATDGADGDLAAVRDMIKETYTRTIGMMGSANYMEGKADYQPERRHHIVGKARANLLRRVTQIGRDTNVWPLAVKTDTVLYASNEADPIAAWPGKPEHLGRGLGQFKVEGSGKLAEQLPYLEHGTKWPAEAKSLVTGETKAGDE